MLLVALFMVRVQGWSAQVGALERTLRKDGLHSKALALGTSHTLALASDGTLYSWGWNDRGQLGLDSRAHRDVPTPVRIVEEAVRRGLSWAAKCVARGGAGRGGGC
jgi:hypothetical protein